MIVKARRRGKVRRESLGRQTFSGVERDVTVIRTPYTAARFRRGKGRGPRVPEVVQAGRDQQTRALRDWMARLDAGVITPAECDREYNALARKCYRRELRTREGLAYYERVFREARRHERNAHREIALVRADRRDRAGLCALRASYRRRSR